MSADNLTAVSELDLLRAESATLQQLISVMERTTLEQTALLERAVQDRTAAADQLRRQLEITRALTESMGEGVLAFTADGLLSFINGAAQLMLQVDQNSVQGRPITEIRLSRRPETIAAISRVFETRFTVRSDDDVFLAGGDKDLAVSYTASPIVAGGEFLGAVVVFHDITSRKSADRERQKLLEEIDNARRDLEVRVLARTAQLEESNRELESFSYSVSHDLRAPIRHISGFVDLFRKRAGEGIDTTSAHYLDVIAGAAKQAGILVDDLLGFSRMGRAEFARQRVSMDAIVKDVLGQLQEEPGARTVEWRIGALGHVTGDGAMLRLVWRNLLSNALKYTRTREAAVIDVQRTEQDHEHVFCVADNGVGFDMKYVHKLFGVFQRLHSTDQFEGTGIGLANVRRIVSRHGGRTWASGEVDRGSTFCFALPRESEESSE